MVDGGANIELPNWSGIIQRKPTDWTAWGLRITRPIYAAMDDRATP